MSAFLLGERPLEILMQNLFLLIRPLEIFGIKGILYQPSMAASSFRKVTEF